MSKTFNVEITQVYKVERKIVVQITADNLESAIEEQSSTDAPDFNDPRWETGWELENESVNSPFNWAPLYREGQIRVAFNGDEWLFHNGEWELGTSYQH